MIRILVFALLLGSGAGCQSALEAVALEGSFCDAVMPPLTPWQGQALPQPQTPVHALYLCPSPEGDDNTWAILSDGAQVTVRYAVAPSAMAAFAAVVLDCPGPVKKATGDEPRPSFTLNCVQKIIKGCTGPGPSISAAYLIYRTHALQDADVRAFEDFPSACPDLANH